MLALMSVASTGGPATLVFDEVDAGVGGQTARAVGDRLRALADGRQVLCITHLPQIASLADRHFRIEKRAAGDLARTTVERLEDELVLDELCRMLGADAETPAPVSTRRTCWRRPSRRSFARRRGQDVRGATLQLMAVSRLTGRPKRARGRARTGPPQPTEFTGCARSGKRTKRLVKTLRPGDIAVIDHEDIDRVSGEDLCASGVRCVLNAARSSTGRYPNVGPLILAEAGVHLVDLPGQPLFDELNDGERDHRRGGHRPARRQAALRGRGAGARRGPARARAPAAEARRGARGVRREHDEPHPRGARAARRPARPAGVRHAASATGRA